MESWNLWPDDNEASIASFSYKDVLGCGSVTLYDNWCVEFLHLFVLVFAAFLTLRAYIVKEH